MATTSPAWNARPCEGSAGSMTTEPPASRSRTPRPDAAIAASSAASRSGPPASILTASAAATSVGFPFGDVSGGTRSSLSGMGPDSGAGETDGDASGEETGVKGEGSVGIDDDGDAPDPGAAEVGPGVVPNPVAFVQPAATSTVARTRAGTRFRAFIGCVPWRRRHGSRGHGTPSALLATVGRR